MEKTAIDNKNENKKLQTLPDQADLRVGEKKNAGHNLHHSASRSKRSIIRAPDLGLGLL